MFRSLNGNWEDNGWASADECKAESCGDVHGIAAYNLGIYFLIPVILWRCICGRKKDGDDDDEEKDTVTFENPASFSVR